MAELPISMTVNGERYASHAEARSACLIASMQAAFGRLPYKLTLTELLPRTIGPTNMGGRCVDLAVYNKEPRIFYVATASGGLWKTLNGGITLDLPSDLSTEVRASTVNGDLVTDYPLTVTGRFGPRRMRGTIGSGGGGRSLNLSTVNGEIRLKKAT